MISLALRRGLTSFLALNHHELARVPALANLALLFVGHGASLMQGMTAFLAVGSLADLTGVAFVHQDQRIDV